MGTHLPDERDRRAEIEVSGHPLYTRERATVKRFVATLRKATSSKDYLELHKDLLGRCLGCERFLDQCEAEHKSLRQEIHDLKATGEPIEKIKPVSRQIGGVDYDRRVGKAILSIYRTLADALVWRILGYRRPVITALGEGSPVRRLATGVGIESELKELTWLWESLGGKNDHRDQSQMWSDTRNKIIAIALSTGGSTCGRL